MALVESLKFYDATFCNNHRDSVIFDNIERKEERKNENHTSKERITSMLLYKKFFGAVYDFHKHHTFSHVTMDSFVPPLVLLHLCVSSL